VTPLEAIGFNLLKLDREVAARLIPSNHGLLDSLLAGRVIVVTSGRQWFPTATAAVMAPFEVTTTGEQLRHYQPAGLPDRFHMVVDERPAQGATWNQGPVRRITSRARRQRKRTMAASITSARSITARFSYRLSGSQTTVPFWHDVARKEDPLRCGRIRSPFSKQPARLESGGRQPNDKESRR
jgi:hypothetical protein